MNNRYIITNISELLNQNSVSTNGERLRRYDSGDFINYGYKVKTRVDKSSQMCIHATFLSNLNTKIKEERGGLITVSQFGSPTSKEAYYEQIISLEEPFYASPMNFVQSICNIPNSMTTIEFGIKGLCNHFVGGAEATILALWQAVKHMKDGQASAMNVSAYETISDQIYNELLMKEKCSDVFYNESASGVRIECDDSGIKEGIQIHGFGFASGDLQTAISRSIKMALKNSRLQVKDITYIFSNSVTDEEYKAYEREVIDELFCNCSVKTIMYKQRLGESFSVSPLQAIYLLKYKKELFGNQNENKHPINVILLGYSQGGIASSVCLSLNS